MIIVPIQTTVDNPQVESPQSGNSTNIVGEKRNKARVVASSVGSMGTMRVRINSHNPVTMHKKVSKFNKFSGL